jgi:NTP pyrophosphatase (non-canonical NTP hydrolase)
MKGSGGIGVRQVDGAILVRSQPSLFSETEQPTGLDEYQEYTTRTDRNGQPGIQGLGFVLLGLFGEVGSLLSALKKKQRDREAFSTYHDAVIEELGDSLWYFANAALRSGLTLSSIAQHTPARWATGIITVSPVREPSPTYSARAPSSGPVANDAVERRLIALAGKVGHLLEDSSNGRIAGNRDLLSGDLVEIFRAVLAAADDAEVSLDEAARRNVVKTLGRWPETLDWGSLFDADFPPEEQLPRKMTIVFSERDIGGRQYVIEQLNGVNIGSRLTDNRHEPDDYRFHDVFHLAFAAILGWSPTLRALLQLKRKSQPSVDENEDGARAIIIEEGISTWVFNHGVRNNDYRSAGSVDYDLLKAVHELVRGYEVEARPAWQWERAILEGFRIFRALREHRGGAVSIDLEQRAISFEPPRGTA